MSKKLGIMVASGLIFTGIFGFTPCHAQSCSEQALKCLYRIFNADAGQRLNCNAFVERAAWDECRFITGDYMRHAHSPEDILKGCIAGHDMCKKWEQRTKVKGEQQSEK